METNTKEDFLGLGSLVLLVLAYVVFEEIMARRSKRTHNSTEGGGKIQSAECPLSPTGSLNVSTHSSPCVLSALTVAKSSLQTGGVGLVYLRPPPLRAVSSTPRRSRKTEKVLSAGERLSLYINS